MWTSLLGSILWRSCCMQLVGVIICPSHCWLRHCGVVVWDSIHPTTYQPDCFGGVEFGCMENFGQGFQVAGFTPQACHDRLPRISQLILHGFWHRGEILQHSMMSLSETWIPPAFQINWLRPPPSSPNSNQSHRQFNHLWHRKQHATRY